MTWKFVKSYELFYFQVRGSLAPLDIPTQTALSRALWSVGTRSVEVIFSDPGEDRTRRDVACASGERVLRPKS